MEITVYHGGTEIIEHPICTIGRPRLDFGCGFYLTDIESQAKQWALFTAKKRGAQAVINTYLLDKEAIIKNARCKIFTAYNLEWLEFVVASRRGLNPAVGYDYIEGGVANDRVIDTVNLYMAGLMGPDMALQRLAQHLPNNQICLLSQNIVDKYLKYYGAETVK